MELPVVNHSDAVKPKLPRVELGKAFRGTAYAIERPGIREPLHLGREAKPVTSVVVDPLCTSRTALPARPAGMEPVTDKSLVDPTAKAVASPVA